MSKTIAQGYERDVEPCQLRDERLINGLFKAETVWMAKAVIETDKIWGEVLADPCPELNQKNAGMREKWKLKLGVEL